MTLGNRIAALRKAAGLSQEALAAKLGVSRQAIGKWEADASLPGLDNLHQLAQALGVSIDALLTGKEAAEPPVPSEDTATEQAPLSLDGVQALLEGQTRSEQRRQKRTLLWLGVPAALTVLALAGGLVWQGGQLADLHRQLNSVQGNIATLEGSLAALQTQLSAGSANQPQAAPSESLLASWDIQEKEYSSAESKMLFALSATPRTITEDSFLRFTFVLSDGQSLSLDAVRGEGDVFFAEGWVPLAESYTLNVSLTANGETLAEQLYTEPFFAGQYEMQLNSLPLVAQSASRVYGTGTFTVRQNAGDYEIPVEVCYSSNGQPYQWPVKAWVTGTLEGEEVLDLALDTGFIQPGSEKGPSEPSGQVTFYLRFTLENKSFTLPWKEEYEEGGWPEIDYQLHILDNSDNESTYSLNL